MAQGGELENNWYCIRTNLKQEHIAAACLRMYREIEVYNPQISRRKSTIRGPVWFTESLFPCYIFARFALKDHLQHVKFTSGVANLVHFNHHYPIIPEEAIEDIRASMGHEEKIVVDPALHPGDQVEISGGCFHGMNGVVLRYRPAQERVAILMDFLGNQTQVTLSADSVVPKRDDRFGNRKTGEDQKGGDSQ